MKLITELLGLFYYARAELLVDFEDWMTVGQVTVTFVSSNICYWQPIYELGISLFRNLCRGESGNCSDEQATMLFVEYGNVVFVRLRILLS